jgi:hypothetical protein
MVPNESAPSSAPAPTGAAPEQVDRERYLAALVRVRADRKINRPTPAWISELVDVGEQKFAR